MIILVIYIYLIIFLKYSYTRTISIESTDIPDELISRFDTTTSTIKNDTNSIIGCGNDFSVYCKDNVCVCVNSSYITPFIELPDKNGYIHRYILIPYGYSYDEVISSYINSNNNKTIHVSTDCKTDNQCFSNKCFNSTCTYNINANVERCDMLYTKPTLSSPSNSYINCGRMIGESCTKATDCSFKNCNIRGECSSGHYEPSETNVVTLGIQKLYLGGIALVFILIIIIWLCCCYYLIKRHKNNNINAENKK